MPPMRFFGDFLSAQKVTRGVGLEAPLCQLIETQFLSIRALSGKKECGDAVSVNKETTPWNTLRKHPLRTGALAAHVVPLNAARFPA